MRRFGHAKLGLGLALIASIVLALGCPDRPAGPGAGLSESAARSAAAATLAAGLTSDDSSLQFASAEYLLKLDPALLADSSLHSPPLGEVLRERLAADTTSLQTRQWLIDLLAASPYWKNLPEDERTATLAWTTAQLEETEVEPREVAAYALFKLGGAERLPDLIALITDPERTVRAIVAEAFGAYGAGTEWPTLRRFAEDENEYVRLRAAKALATWHARLGPQIDHAKAEAQVALLIKDEDPFVRRMAAQAKGIALLNNPLAWRQQIYTPLLIGRPPAPDTEEWEFFRDAALGRFEWSLGYSLPVPSEISRLVFQFLWEESGELQPDVLEAAALQAHPGESGFLQSAWLTGNESLRLRALQLMTDILHEGGELGSEFDEVIRDIGALDLVNESPELRAEAVRFILTLARSRSLARFDEDTNRGWEAQVTDLFYSPRDTVRALLRTLNPAHPWLQRAGAGRFAADERLRPTLPRLARMVWYEQDPRAVDPATGELGESLSHPLTAEELDQLWRWGVVPPLPVLGELLDPDNAPVSIAGIRAAAILLRGAVPVTPLTPGTLAPEDWVEGEARPTLPPDDAAGRPI